MDIVEHLHRENKQDSVKLTRGMKGTYGWEIKVHGFAQLNKDKIISRVKALDQELKNKFIQEKKEEMEQ